MLILIIISINSINNTNKLNNNHLYAIGKVYKIEYRGVKANILFEFNVNDSTYKTKFSTNIGFIRELDRDIEGNRFYVKFYPKRPKNCDILFGYPVPDLLKNQPKGGWKAIP